MPAVVIDEAPQTIPGGRGGSNRGWRRGPDGDDLASASGGNRPCWPARNFVVDEGHVIAMAGQNRGDQFRFGERQNPIADGQTVIRRRRLTPQSASKFDPGLRSELSIRSITSVAC